MKTLQEFIERYFKNIKIKVYSGEITEGGYELIDKKDYNKFVEDDIDEIDPDLLETTIYLKEDRVREILKGGK